MSPQESEAVRKIVTAGKKIMFDKNTFKMLKAGMVGNAPMPDKLAKEAVGLMKLLQDRANGGIPRQLLIPAGAMLLLEIAKFLEDAKIAKPTPQDIKAAYAKLVDLMAKVFPQQKQPAQPAPPAAAPQPGILGGVQNGVA